MLIQDFKLGIGKAFIIAEIAQSHDGDLDEVHRYIELIADAGADAIKLQTHIAEAESTLDEPFRVSISGGDKTRFDYWKRMEFSFEQWVEIQNHCSERGIIFLSSAFSVEAVELLEKLAMPAWKVGSGEFASFELLEAMAATGKPVLLSSGMSTYEEVSRGVDFIRSKGAEVALFQCTSKYPTGLRQVGLNVMEEFRSRFGCLVGLSDHSSSIFPSMAALAREADMIEVHVIDDVNSDMPDAKSSLTISDLNLLVQARDAFFEMFASPVDKNSVALELKEMRKLFTKSLAFKQDQPSGMIITDEMLTSKKPGTGISPAIKHEIVGRKLIRDVDHNRLLRLEDFENE